MPRMDQSDQTAAQPTRPLVSAEWLMGVLGGVDKPVVVDVRWSPTGPSSLEMYESGHIAGAQRLDLDADLSEITDLSTGRHPLPTPQRFVETLAMIGIGRESMVVVYDHGPGFIAARLYWMLRHWLGHQTCAVLDGGLGAWQRAGGHIVQGSAESSQHSKNPIEPRAKQGAIVTKGTIADLISVSEQSARTWGGAIGVDARAPERFRGEVEPLDPHAGHIPGARNVPCSSFIDGQTHQMLSPEQIRLRFAAAGVEEENRMIASCGSGVTACHLILAAEIAGLPIPVLYPGSWSEWCRDATLPRG